MSSIGLGEKERKKMVAKPISQKRGSQQEGEKKKSPRPTHLLLLVLVIPSLSSFFYLPLLLSFSLFLPFVLLSDGRG